MPLQEEQNDTSEEGSSGNSGQAVETSSNVVDERNPSVGKDHNYF